MHLGISGLCPLLQVFDMPASVTFYRDLLGFTMISSSPPYGTQDGNPLFHWVLLRCGDAELMLNTAYDEGERPESPDRTRLLGHQDLGLFMSCPDVDEAFRRLTEKGVRCSPPHTATYGMRQTSCSDPDGFRITLQWPAHPATLDSEGA